MIRADDARTPGWSSATRGVITCLAVLGLLLLDAGAGAAQDTQRPSDPGPLEVIGRLIDESIAGINANVKGARDSLDHATGQAGEAAKGAARNATNAVTRLPRPGIVAGREFCPPAANGAPDCRVAANLLCRAKGFEAGRSVDFQSEQKCPVLPSGRTPTEEECWLESYVTRALCQ